MKKSISIVLVLSIIASFFAMCGVTAFAEENNILDYITYEIDEYYEGVVILSCDPSISGDVVIPNTIEGQPVITILEDAFAECDGITSVYIPENIREDSETFSFIYYGFGLNIEKYIVDENNKYFSSDEDGIIYNKDKTTLLRYPCGKDNTEYAIPDSVDRIGDGAFMDCSSLINITIPDSVVSIQPQAFMNCTSLEYMKVPDSVSAFDYGVFAGCTLLDVVEFGDGIKSFFPGTFDGCVNLEKIILGSGFEEFEHFTCLSLKDITVDEENKYFSSEDGVLYNKDKTKLIMCPMGKTECYIPDGVETIGELAFGYCMSLTKVVLPASVKNIDTGAFYFSLALENVEIGSSVEQISSLAFLACPLKEIRITSQDVVLEPFCLGYDMFGISCDSKYFADLYRQGLIARMLGDEDTLQEIGALIDAVCVYYDEPTATENFTIHGYAGSTAETYANENGFKFVPLCRHNYVDTVITPATYTQTGVGGNVCEFCEDVLDTYEIPMLEIEDSEEKIDNDTGVSVVFPEGTFEGEAEIEVKPVEDGEAYKLISHKEGNYKVTMFDINVTVDGENVQPNGTVLVQIPLPKGYNQNKCVVYYVADDGTMEELKTYHNKDGYVYFETDHFSYYAILEETTVTEDNSTETENHFISYLRSLLNKYIAAFLKFIDMLKSLFGLA